MTAIALTIAGSDSGGGAGIQADLKTFSARGVYGCSVIAALTAQNTKAVTGIFNIDPGFVAAQIDAVFDDLKVDAVKIGMLGRPEVIDVVAERLEHWQPQWVVLDPVMVAKSGAKLLQDNAIAALRERLMPLASLITPNLPEAKLLIGDDNSASPKLGALAARLQGLGARNVLIKGGHLEGEDSPDLLLFGGEHYRLDGPRIATRNTHGTGCTLSAAIASELAKGQPLPSAVRTAKDYLTQALEAADMLEIGQGFGPVHHFHEFWSGERPTK
ncbi:MAG: bifunctional hydroxymethylpyrimidine kinase/phosphomethylpyrimidine kinase [Pseudomonadota bacterium]